MKKQKTIFRTECNSRSKIFNDINKAMNHFIKCKLENKNIEIWTLTYLYNEKMNRWVANQILLDYYTRV